VTYVESAKCRALNWVVHVPCVKGKRDNGGFLLGSGEEGQPLERPRLQLSDNVKSILKIRFEIVDWINPAQVYDRYHSEQLPQFFSVFSSLNLIHLYFVIYACFTTVLLQFGMHQLNACTCQCVHCFSKYACLHVLTLLPSLPAHFRHFKHI
jgi:hypothetical protein